MPLRDRSSGGGSAPTGLLLSRRGPIIYFPRMVGRASDGSLRGTPGTGPRALLEGEQGASWGLAGDQLLISFCWQDIQWTKLIVSRGFALESE